MIETAEKKQVIKAIGDLGRKVTVADVSAKTGLPVLKVSQALNQVASETGGHLQVSKSGDIAYNFPIAFTNRYLTSGINRVLNKVLEATGKVLLYLFKISFGVMLILSLVIVVIAIFVLMFALKSQGRSRDNDGPDFDIDFSFFDYLILRDLFYFTVQSTTTASYDYDRPTIKQQKKSNFLLNCFSFLFGDGNPNEGLEEKRWQLIASVIKKHDNVMTAEQLAPYTGSNPMNEDGVLPVLVRFNGTPEVTETGNIVYRFPDLSTTTGTIRTTTPPPFLSEFPWKFTQVSAGSLTPVYIVAGLNFFGSWYIWSILQSHYFSDSIALLFNVLVIYGSLFLLIPLGRFTILQIRNSQIEKRNKERAGYSELLVTPTAKLEQKLLEAQSYKTKDKRIKTDEIVYTTEQNSLDQEDDLSLQFKKMNNDSTFDASP